MDDATIKDLALKFWTSREVHRVDRRVYLNIGRCELRSRREGRNFNGVKNLYGSENIPKYLLLTKKEEGRNIQMI